MSILNAIPDGWTPRDEQTQILQWIEANWDRYDVLVVTAPVACGKSLVGETIARWRPERTAYLTPTRILQDQLAADFPGKPNLKGMSSYKCKDFPEVSCHDMSLAQGDGGKRSFCPGCPYNQARAGARKFDAFYNYWTYYANIQSLQAETLIIDEAHNLLPFLSEVSTIRIWEQDMKFPADLETVGDAAALLERYATKLRRQLARMGTGDEVEKAKTGRRLAKVAQVLADLMHGGGEFYIQVEKVEFRGRSRKCLRIQPLAVRGLPAKLWGRGTNKVVLMSATINPFEVERLGLANRKVGYFTAGSPIPAESRPIHVESLVNLSWRNQDKAVPVLARRLKELLVDHPDEKGIIHAPYSLAAKLRSHLSDGRLMWHDKDNKQAQYDEFRATTEPRVLVASGMDEGIDLVGDAGRWQVITKVQYPSLGDGAMKQVCDNDPKAYRWEAIRSILQASGRICRTPDDYGETYIMDSSFPGLFYKNKEMFPVWFKEAMNWPKC